MRYVRPFRTDGLAPASEFCLISPDEDVGCAIRVRRGGAQDVAEARDSERYAIVLEGRPSLCLASERRSAEPGNILFLPAGERGVIAGDPDAVWIEIETQVQDRTGASEARIVEIDESKFEGDGFAYQALLGRGDGAQGLRMNLMQVQPGAGSPDFHIHAFAQIYLIENGVMTLDIGRQRCSAPALSLVFLPAGVVHRNFNASDKIERHISLLVPEPSQDSIFDYAVTIEEKEATLLSAIP